jgi:hypothetical protein
MTDKEKTAFNVTGTMRKFGQKFGAAKINVLEKMGKRDTTESAEMQYEYKVSRDHIREEVKLIAQSRKLKKRENI